MAGAESLLGANSDQVLSQETQNLLNGYLGDTVDGIHTVTFPGGSEGTQFGNTLVTSNGSGGVSQGVMIARTQAATAQVQKDVTDFDSTTPAFSSIAFTGLPTLSTPAQAETFYQQRIDVDLPKNSTDPFVLAQRANLEKALANLTAALEKEGASSNVVNIVETVTSPLVLPGNNVVFDAKSANSQVAAFILGNQRGVGNNDVLSLKGVEKAIVINSGTVVVTDSTPSFIQGDLSNQNITGGGGNDTLVGGGGNDTLVGGGGKDAFGFTDFGNTTIQGFGKDSELVFQFAGVNSIQDLLQYLTGVTESDGNVTYEFAGVGSSITLVGVSASEVTADMVKFVL